MDEEIEGLGPRDTVCPDCRLAFHAPLGGCPERSLLACPPR